MKVMFVFGTRPEAIKMAPLVKRLRDDAAFDVTICVTAQHREMLDQVLAFFSIVPDFDLDLMTKGQSLSALTANALSRVTEVMERVRPDVVLVQGDTTTAFVGGLAAFYQRARLGHVEAGLRTGRKDSPFPEEINRTLISRVADYHFAPTQLAATNLRNEGVVDGVWTVGNTAIDALHLGLEILGADGGSKVASFFEFLKPDNRVVLVTNHRRESFGRPLQDLCGALRTLGQEFPDTQFVYPVHLNPNVRGPVHDALGSVANFHLTDPLEYPQMIWLMNRSHIIITDSGGIQEEAPSLGKPILVTREVTERQEGVEAGTARLVGTDYGTIVREATRLLTDDESHAAMARQTNPYGSGDTALQIRDILKSVA